MQDFVPEDVTALIAEIEAQKDADYQVRKLREETELARLRGIEDLRQERASDLIVACGHIGQWIATFETEVGPSIWRLNNDAGIVIFSAKFWRGEPTPPNDVTCSAQLRLGPPEKTVTERLVYEELHKGHVSAKQPLLCADHLWVRTHPAFVTECAAHLASGRVWDTIRITLERLKKPASPAR